MRSPLGSRVRSLAAVQALLAASACVHGPLRGPRGISADRVLIFEQRVAASGSSTEPAWESWQLYESGRFVYARAGAATTQRRIQTARLQAVHSWLYAHDRELERAPTAAPLAATTPAPSAVCQLHTSRGLMLATLGEPNYGACEELRKLAFPE